MLRQPNSHTGLFTKATKIVLKWFGIPIGWILANLVFGIVILNLDVADLFYAVIVFPGIFTALTWLLLGQRNLHRDYARALRTPLDLQELTRQFEAHCRQFHPGEMQMLEIERELERLKGCVPTDLNDTLGRFWQFLREVEPLDLERTLRLVRENQDGLRQQVEELSQRVERLGMLPQLPAGFDQAAFAQSIADMRRALEQLAAYDQRLTELSQAVADLKPHRKGKPAAGVTL